MGKTDENHENDIGTVLEYMLHQAMPQAELWVGLMGRPAAVAHSMREILEILNIKATYHLARDAGENPTLDNHPALDGSEVTLQPEVYAAFDVVLLAFVLLAASTDHPMDALRERVAQHRARFAMEVEFMDGDSV